jgi:IclR family transcriptional regulator, KDG regulon repressor
LPKGSTDRADARWRANVAFAFAGAVILCRVLRRDGATSIARAKSEQKGTSLKALDKTFRVLDLFSVARPEWGLLELSEAAGLPVSTLHRIITVLRRHGLVTQDSQSKKYRLGYGAIDLGRRAVSGLTVRQVASPLLRRLADQTGETIVLTVLNDSRDRAVCIERIESRHDLRLHLEVGEQSYLHAGASSKVLLAYFSAQEVADLVRRVGLPPLAHNTIQDLSALEEDLARIRDQGYAFSREETNAGAWGVAAPVLDPEGRAIAAIGIAAPTSRYNEDAERRFVALTLQAGREVGAELGVPAAS